MEEKKGIYIHIIETKEKKMGIMRMIKTGINKVLELIFRLILGERELKGNRQISRSMNELSVGRLGELREALLSGDEGWIREATEDFTRALLGSGDASVVWVEHRSEIEEKPVEEQFKVIEEEGEWELVKPLSKEAVKWAGRSLNNCLKEYPQGSARVYKIKGLYFIRTKVGRKYKVSIWINENSMYMSGNALGGVIVGQMPGTEIKGMANSGVKEKYYPLLEKLAKRLGVEWNVLKRWVSKYEVIPASGMPSGVLGQLQRTDRIILNTVGRWVATYREEMGDRIEVVRSIDSDEIRVVGRMGVFVVAMEELRRMYDPMYGVLDSLWLGQVLVMLMNEGGMNSDEAMRYTQALINMR